MQNVNKKREIHDENGESTPQILFEIEISITEFRFVWKQYISLFGKKKSLSNRQHSLERDKCKKKKKQINTAQTCFNNDRVVVYFVQKINATYLNY